MLFVDALMYVSSYKIRQATELNYSIREMHTFLRHHFLDYVDVHGCLPSKVRVGGEAGAIFFGEQEVEISTKFWLYCASRRGYGPPRHLP